MVEVLPQWAKDLLIGQTVASVSEVFPHTLSLKFSNGTFLSVTGMSFADGTIDASVIEGFDESIEAITKK